MEGTYRARMASEATVATANTMAVENKAVDDKAFTLFIPHVHDKTSPQKIFAVFRNLGLGRLGHPDGGEAIVLTDRKDQEGRPYKTAQVHFQHLFARGKNGAENVRIFQHLSENRDNFITVEHMPEKVCEDGRVLPARYWKPRLDRPFRKVAGDGGAVRSAMKFGKLERKPKVEMLATDEDWGDDVKHEAGATADEAVEVARQDSAEAVADEADEVATEMTDEEYAAQVLAGGSA